MSVDISIIIVSFNTCDLLKNCLVAVDKYSDDLACETIVVDNNSQDGSQAMVTSEFPDVHLIINAGNAGFARANNQGISVATGTYVFLLNPDTELFPRTLHTLKSYMDCHPMTGAVGPRTFLDHSKTLEVCSLKILTPLRAVTAFTRLPFPGRKKILETVWNLDHQLFLSENPLSVEGIGGAAFFTRKSFLDDIHGLDEQFFMGYEDTDLAAAIARNNHTIEVLDTSHVLHLFGQAKKLPVAPDSITYDWQQAPARFLKKYYGARATWMLRLSRIIDSVWRRLQGSSHPDVCYESKADIALEWRGDSHTKYLFELSNDKPFFDKFGIPVQGNRMVIPAELCQRLTEGIWYWRIWVITDGKCESVVHNSWFTLSRSHT